MAKRICPIKQKNLYVALLNLLDSFTTGNNSESKLLKLNLKIDKKEKKVKYKKDLLDNKEQQLKDLKIQELQLVKDREILQKDETKPLQEAKKLKKREKTKHEDEGAKKFKELELSFTMQFDTLKKKQNKISSKIEKIKNSLIRVNTKLGALKAKAQMEENVSIFIISELRKFTHCL